MSDWLPAVWDSIDRARLMDFVMAALLLVVGIILARLLSQALVRAFQGRLDSHRTMLLRRGTSYLVLAIFISSALYQMGFNLNVLLGTAGILSVAVGFASQTSMSNLISGLFLVAERPFMVGDVITLGDTTGEVLSVDLLSVKLRKFDNTFVRIPNELLVKSQVTTLTKFPIRRVDIKLGLSYKSDLAQVRQLLFAAAEGNPLALQEPRPVYIFLGFGSSSLDIQFSVWATRENYLAVLNGIKEEIKTAFDSAGVEMAFPHLSLYAGTGSNPLPVQWVGGTPAQQPDEQGS